MKKPITVINFTCDRCKTTEEKNINKDTGIIYTLEVKQCEDMKYGNVTTRTIDLCQKCSEDFRIFITSMDHIKDLQYYHDTTIGLWCTDRPDLVKSDLLFELKD